MNRIKTETAVGFFFILGLLTFSFMAVQLGGLGGVGSDEYLLKARFVSSAGLKVGAPVEVAGVAVGKVKRITLDAEEYEAVIELSLPKSVKVQEDAIASVSSSGLLGGKYIKISPGGADEVLSPGDEITETESSVSFGDLIGKYMFSGKDDE